MVGPEMALENYPKQDIFFQSHIIRSWRGLNCEKSHIVSLKISIGKIRRELEVFLKKHILRS